MDYIDRLTELRIDRDVKQTKIAELLGCKQSAVSKYETRKVPYHTEDIAKLCRFYNVSADYVLGLPEGIPDGMPAVFMGGLPGGRRWETGRCGRGRSG